MKKLLLTCVLLALCAPTAVAGGVNIAWGNGCWSDPGLHSNLLSFACNSNYGSAIMTCSFRPNAEQTLQALEVYLDGQSQSETIPDWWQLNPDASECRAFYGPWVVSASWDFPSGPDQVAETRGPGRGGNHRAACPTTSTEPTPEARIARRCSC